MDATRTNTGHLNRCSNPETDSGIGEAPAKQLEQQAQQFAQKLEAAKSSLPSSIPLHSMHQKQAVSTSATSSTSRTSSTSTAVQNSAIPVHTEHVELENHVSMQIFSSPMTQNSNRVVMFLHGGPGLAYDESFKPVTDWCLGHGYTLVAPEIAGSGKAGLRGTSNGYTQNYVRDLKAVIHNLRERPDMQGKEVCVVAHSWGGFQLASLMTDESAEERSFFKQAVFIACNLDSAQTRLFEAASEYSEQAPPLLLGFEHKIVSSFTERHAGGNDAMDASQRMTVVNNPLMDQSLNEKFSPFYRLEKMPQQTPCLFIHATDDGKVPVSQSVDAFKRINDSGGDAKILIASQGGHGFFKTGNEHHAATMSNCFGAIEGFIKDPHSANKATIDDACLQKADALHIEERLRETDRAYENAGMLLENFHRGVADAPAEGRKRIPPKKVLLEKLAGAHQFMVKMFEGNNAPVAVTSRTNNERALSLIKQTLPQI